MIVLEKAVVGTRSFFTDENVQKCKEIEKELVDNGFTIDRPRYGNNFIIESYGASIRVKKYGLLLTLNIQQPSCNNKNDKIVFESNENQIFFDINKVVDYFESYKIKEEKRKIRENCAAFNEPMLISYIEGTLHFAGIEYEKETQYHCTYFKTPNFKLTYVKLPPGKLAKLNIKNIDLRLEYTRNSKNYSCEIKFTKFVESPETYMEEIATYIDELNAANEKLCKIRTDYANQIKQIEAELGKTAQKGFDLNKKKYESQMKEMFKKKNVENSNC